MLRVERFTQSAQNAAQRAAEIMQRYSYHQLDTEHVLLALVEQPQGVLSQLLDLLRVDAKTLAERLDHILRSGLKGDIVPIGEGQIAITPRVVEMLTLGEEETNRLRDEHISTEHLFLAILREQDTPAARLLEEVGLTHARAYDSIQQLRG